VLAANTGLWGGEIKKLRVGSLDLENRRLKIRRADTRSDAGARTVELNRDATDAATRLLMRALTLMPPAKEPEHYLMFKHLSRIAHGEHKEERGYDPTQHQQYWDTAWHSLNRKGRFSGAEIPRSAAYLHHPHGRARCFYRGDTDLRRAHELSDGEALNARVERCGPKGGRAFGLPMRF
jgi:hypothetical protein